MRVILCVTLSIIAAIGFPPAAAMTPLHAGLRAPSAPVTMSGADLGIASGMTPFPADARVDSRAAVLGHGPGSSGFVLPVSPPATVLTPFDPPAHRYGSGHRGVDLAAPAGATVRAAGPGTVIYAGPVAGRGVISIQHTSGLRTTYEPVTADIAAGNHVARGQVIGHVEPGHPSCAPAACLHFGARLPGRVYVDPMSLIDPLRVRLKPWDGG